MTMQLSKDSIDLGIVTNNPGPMVEFYQDMLGFEPQGEMPMAGGGKMVRLLCGTSLIKIVAPAKPPATDAAPGGFAGATGYRYWTISVSNLDALTQKCADAGIKIAVPLTEVRPGVRISIVEDPDGNWVEFLQNG